MRLVRPAAISALAVVMAVFTPYVLRTESMWQVAATGAGLAALIRAKPLFRGLERDTRSDVAET
ncbi:hypothetical protein ACFV1C_10535 [Streptomyces sp. NPDC059605]|uniref:hypothetical protein n=1 Tax=unclassified Streptomyces TaxID=2593676 RepID=UPI0036C9979F